MKSQPAGLQFLGYTALLVLAAQPRVEAGARSSQLVNSRKHLVLDSRVFAQTHDVRLVLGRIEKDPRNPLFQADLPWENSLNNLYPNIAYDEKDGRFKLWYKDMLCDAGVINQMMPPRIVEHVGWFLLYATSRDGLVWHKPQLGLIGFNGSTRNNVVARDTANTGVFLDRHDPDPARRFKMVHDEGPGELRVRFSADGIRWTEALTPHIVGEVGDTHNNAFYDERTGKYVLITRLFQGERKVARSESRDFMNWTDAQLILESLPSEKGRRQTYCMPAFAYANVYLGFLMLYNTGGDKNVDCELTWSPDTVQWHRVNPGTPFIPHGTKGSYDWGCIYAQAGPPVLDQRRLMIFYGGSTNLHIGRKRHALPCLAWLRADGFAAFEPTSATAKGIVVTQPLRCAGEPLRISADARGGSVRVAVVDEAGFELERCQPIREDVTDFAVRWEGDKDFSELKEKTVRLKFELERARLYAFSGLELPTGNSAPQVSAESEPAGEAPSESRRPASDAELRYWLENMRVYHRFTAAEISAATGLTPAEVTAALDRFDLASRPAPPRQAGEPLRVLPYPGGRHPRIGFLEGAIRPQRETKISVFTPWDDADYVVVDVPEAIWSNLGLTYLAHTHIPTVWSRQDLELPKLEWNRRPDGTLDSERTLPNGIVFGAKVRPTPTAVRMDLWLRNGTREKLTGLRVQNCVMLKAAAGFEAQTLTNKVFAKPYAAVRSVDGPRWIITGWDPCDRCWGNDQVPCIHADPQFPDCAPGATVRLRGVLAFYEGADIQAAFAQLNRSGWRQDAGE